MNASLRLWAIAVLALFTSHASAALKLPAIVSDGMVLQRHKPVTLWGWADPGAQVTVQLNGDKERARADAAGRWQVELPKLKAGGPHEIDISTSTGDRTTIKDVLIGEVWICSGQSNMAWPMAATTRAEQEIAAATYPLIRLIEIPRQSAEEPQSDVAARWSACTPETARNFSAVAYFFGRKLHQELDVPIGLINSSYGGTPAEAWTSRPALEAESILRPLLERWDAQVAAWNPQEAQAAYEQRLAEWQAQADKLKTEGKPAPRKPAPPQNPAISPHRPAGLYNAMIAPIQSYTLAGAIWYQGESNVSRAYQYRTVFPTMITDWRDQFGHKDMPFYFVQIAPFRYGGQDPTACAELWEAQLLTLKSVKNTGMVVTTDIGDIKDIHPTNKQDVGHRLALWALARTYGHKSLACSGPIFKKSRARGESIILEFEHTGSGLASRDGKPLTHFQIAGEDKQFHPATAMIDGDRLIVRAESVKEPVAVRFAWTDTAEPNLINKEGLPAAPFRTDTWKGVTVDNH
jgi:sialate O-acetylesterase